MNREAPARGKLTKANPSPCSSCPWRTANHGQPHPDGWFTAKNRDRLWAQLRRGETMSCHPTDPSNPVPEGGKQVAEGTETHECAGGLVLQQREIMKVQTYSKPSFPQYRKAHPRGLTKEGFLILLNRALFGGVPFVGGLKMAETDLNEEVSHPPLGEWDSEKVQAAVKAQERS